MILFLKKTQGQPASYLTRTGMLLAFFLAAFLCMPPLSRSDSTSKQPPLARKGLLDLSAWSFDKDGTAKLDGEWEFYWRQLLKPEDFARRGSTGKPGYIRLPGTWDGSTAGSELIGNQGFATYRLIVRGAHSGSSLALYLPPIYSAYTVWIDGRPLASAGKVGRSRSASSSYWKTQVVPIGWLEEEAEIVIQASNFFFRYGGIRGEIKLGSNAELSGRKYLDLAVMSLIFGSLVIMGFYHLSLFVFRKKDRSYLYFGIFCLLIGVYTLTGPDEHLIADALPEMNGEFVYRLQLMVAIVSLPIFFIFQQALYPDDVSRKLGKVLVSVAAVYLILFLALPSDGIAKFDLLYHPVTMMTSLYLVSTLAKSFMRKREGAHLALGGALVLLVTVISDILYDFGIGQFNMATPIGVLVFILSYSFILSKRFSKAFTVIEQQEAALQRANIGLEAKVRDRTASLEQSIQEKEVLLREIHHRVKNNLQVIVSLLNLQSDEVAEESTLHALAESKGRIKAMMHVHEKLYNSRNLAQIDFREYIGNLASDIFSTFGADRERIGLEIEAPGRKLDLDAAMPCGLIVNELVTNSLKYAFPEGRTGCRISVRLGETGGGGFELIVADNGVGLPGHVEMSAASTLGLRLVYGLAKRQLKGDIAISGEQGTQVSVRFGKQREQIP